MQNVPPVLVRDCHCRDDLFILLHTPKKETGLGLPLAPLLTSISKICRSPENAAKASGDFASGDAGLRLTPDLQF